MGWVGRVLSLKAPLYSSKHAPEGPQFLWLLEASASQTGRAGTVTLETGSLVEVIALWQFANDASDHCFVTAVLAPVRSDSSPALFGMVLEEHTPDGKVVTDEVQDQLEPVAGSSASWNATRFDRMADALARQNSGWQLAEWLARP